MIDLDEDRSADFDGLRSVVEGVDGGAAAADVGGALVDGEVEGDTCCGGVLVEVVG